MSVPQHVAAEVGAAAGLGAAVGLSVPAGLGAAVQALAEVVPALPPSVGATRLIAVDGLSGSGKTTVADALARTLEAPILHLDDVYQGWDGLDGVTDLVLDWIVRPLRTGQEPRWRPYTWATGERGPWQVLPAAPVVLIEGCGAGARSLAADLAFLIWVDTAAAERETRLRARPDWTGYSARRAHWVQQEERMLHRENTPARADVALRTTDPPALLWPRRDTARTPLPERTPSL